MEIIRHLSTEELTDFAIESDQQALRSTLEGLPEWARVSTERPEEFWQEQRRVVWSRIASSESSPSTRLVRRSPLLAWSAVTVLVCWLDSCSIAVLSVHPIGLSWTRPRTLARGGARGIQRRTGSAGSSGAPGRGNGPGHRLHIPRFAKRSRLMKTKSSALLAILLFTALMLAQGRPAASSSTTVTTAGPRATFVYRGELGKWWQNSDIAKKLQLSDGQIGTARPDFL